MSGLRFHNAKIDQVLGCDAAKKDRPAAQGGKRAGRPPYDEKSSPERRA